MSNFSTNLPRRTTQRGATLFIALTILVLLTLLALSAAQVTGLQERMSGIYRADNAAFQATEDVLRDAERAILLSPVFCDFLPEPAIRPAWKDNSVSLTAPVFSWGNPKLLADYASVENLNNSVGDSVGKGVQLQGSARFGADNVPGGEKCLVFRVSSIHGDSDTNATSRAIVQSIFIP